MKLNNKGFAISSIMYIILILAVILISVTLAILSSRKLILDKIKKETTDNIYGISYNSVISTLKHEAINYASINNIEQENIKIGDFETSVSQELLEHHELLDKYLSLFKNNYNYDIYLGQPKKVTDISKPIDNMIGVVDYKIEGNSYTGKNLFDISQGESSSSSSVYLKNDILYTPYTKGNTKSARFNQYIEVKPNTTYVYNHNYTGGDRVIIMLYDENKTWIEDSSISIGSGWKFLDAYSGYYGSGINHSVTIPENCKYVRFAYCSMSQAGEGNHNSYYNIQFEEGETATSYEPYVGGEGSPSPKHPQEIKSVGEKSKNLFNINNLTSSTYIKNNNDGTITVTKYAANSDVTLQQLCPELKVGDIVYLSMKTTGEQTMYLSDGTNWNIGSKKTITQEMLDAKAYFYTGVNDQDTPVIISNIQIFEHYDYRIPVKVSGKNLFNKDEVKYITDSYLDDTGVKTAYSGTSYTDMKIKVTPNNIYTLSGLITEEATNVVGVYYFDEEKNFISRYTLKGVNNFTFNTPLNCYYVDFQFRTSNNNFDNWQLEEGEATTEYEPYVEPVTTNIYLDEPLRKIGDYSDKIDFEQGVVNRNVKKLILDGSYKPSLGNWRNVEGYYAVGYPQSTIPDSYKTNEIGKILCEQLPNKTYENLYSINKPVEGISTNSTSRYSIFIRLKTDTITTVDQYLEYLNSNPLTINYVLATPDSQQTNLPNIQTKIGSSIIEVDTSIQPSNIEFTIIEKIRKL